MFRRPTKANPYLEGHRLAEAQFKRRLAEEAARAGPVPPQADSRQTARRRARKVRKAGAAIAQRIAIWGTADLRKTTKITGAQVKAAMKDIRARNA